MANWNLPGLTDLYANVLTYLKDRLNDAVMMLDSALTAPTNLPTGAKRWNASSNKFEKWSGSAWGDMATGNLYAINISGNAATATTAGSATIAGSCSGNAATATTAGACSGNSATVTHNASRTDAAAYPVVWASGANSPMYSCAAVTINSSTGQLSATSFNSTSLRAAKYDIAPLAVDALGIIDGTEVCSYRYKEDESAELRVGFIADDTHELMAGEEHNRFNMNNTVGLLLRAVQQLSARVKELEAAANDHTC